MTHFGMEKPPSYKQTKERHYNIKKKPPKKGYCAQKFDEFCKRTDLHGYKYIVMEDFSYVERSCWTFAVIVSIFTAAYFVVTAYRWYARNPIVTVIESTQAVIWDIPFPAVTICDLNMVSKRAARMLADNLTLPINITSEYVFDTLRLVPMLHQIAPSRPEDKDRLKVLQTILDLNNISIMTLFERLSPAYKCSHLIQRCMWKNTIFRCEELFRHIYTVLSLCCTFNYFATDSATQMETEFSRLTTPRRVASCGYQTALSVVLNTNPDDYYSATIASQGIMVFIDNAYNIPDLDSPTRMVNPSTEVLIALSPEWTYTTSGVKFFKPEDRQCYYKDELRMGDFRQYSFHNCLAYQKSTLISRVCDCSPLHFPQYGYRTCNFNDIECMERVATELQHWGANLSESSSIECLPECEHYDYPLEVALGRLADNVYVNGLPFFDDLSLRNRSILNVFFNDLVSTKYRRDVYLNWENILAAFGGLLSLMLGFTLISGFDLILFIIVKVFYDSLKRWRKKNKGNKTNVKEAVHKKVGWTEKSSFGYDYDKY